MRVCFFLSTEMECRGDPSTLHLADIGRAFSPPLPVVRLVEDAGLLAAPHPGCGWLDWGLFAWALSLSSSP